MEVSKNQGTPKSSSSASRVSLRPDHSFLHYCPAAVGIRYVASDVGNPHANWKFVVLW